MRGWRGAGSGSWWRCATRAVIGLDRALRCFGGAPTYVLTDNERDGVGRSYVRDRGPQRADRQRRPALRRDDSAVACRPIRTARVAARRPCGSRRPICCPSITRSGLTTPGLLPLKGSPRWASTRPFPDRAASLLPGLLAASRTGLTPVGDKLVSDQVILTNLLRLPGARGYPHSSTRWGCCRVHGRGRGAVPSDRRRLREPLDRAQLQHPPSGSDELMPKTIATATSTGSCTTPTSSSPTRPRATASPRRPPGRGPAAALNPRCTAGEFRGHQGERKWPRIGVLSMAIDSPVAGGSGPGSRRFGKPRVVKHQSWSRVPGQSATLLRLGTTAERDELWGWVEVTAGRLRCAENNSRLPSSRSIAKNPRLRDSASGIQVTSGADEPTNAYD